MTFKDDLREDIATFLCPTEFSEYVQINGVLLPAQVSNHTAEKSGRQNENYDGLHGDFVEVYFSSAPYLKKRGKLPKQGDWIYIQSKRYDVVSAQDELGIAKIICAAYRQNAISPKPFAGGRTSHDYV